MASHDDLRRADDARGPIRFGAVAPADGASRMTVVACAVAGLTVVVTGGVVLLVVALVSWGRAGAPMFGPAPPPALTESLAWLASYAVWTAASLLVPVLVARRRPEVGWVCGGLSAIVPFLFLVSQVVQVVGLAP